MEPQTYVVMLVDDDEAIRKSYVDEFHQIEGFVIEEFGSGKQAWAQIEADPRRYHAVILDAVLKSGISGKDLQKKILARFPYLPIFAYTGKNLKMGREVAQAGVYSYTVGQLDIPQIAHAIRNLAAQDFVFQHVASAARHFMNADMAVAWKPDASRPTLHVVATDSDTLPDDSYRQAMELSLEEPNLRAFFARGAPIYVEDIGSSEVQTQHNSLKFGLEQGWHSLVSLPLKDSEQIVGQIDCYWKKSRPYTTENWLSVKPILADLADLAAKAARFSNLAVGLQQIQEMLALHIGILDEDAILERILDLGIKLTEADSGWLYLVDQGARELYLHSWKGIPENVTVDQVRPIDKGITGHVAGSGVAINVPDVLRHPWFVPIRGLEVQSEIVVPLRRQEETKGVLAFKSRFANAFTSDQEDLLKALAHQASIAIGYARLNKHLRDISEQALHTDFHALGTKVVAAAHDLVGTPVNLWMLSDKRQGETPQILRREASAGWNANDPYSMDLSISGSLGKSTLAQILYKGPETLVIDDLINYKGTAPFVQASELINQGWRSWMAVRLVGPGDTPIGILTLYGRLVGTFGTADRELVELLSSQVTIAFQQQRRLNSLHKLAEMSEVLSSALLQHPLTAMRVVAEQAHDLVEADVTILFPYDPEQQRFVTYVDEPENAPVLGLKHMRLSSVTEPREQGIAALVRSLGEIVITNIDKQGILIGPDPHSQMPNDDVAKIKKEIRASRMIKGERIQSFVGIALRPGYANETQDDVGVLYVDFRSKRDWLAEDLQILRIFAHQAANVISGSRQYHREQIQRHYSDALSQASQSLSATVTHDPIAMYSAILGELQNILQCETASVQLLSEDRRQVVAGLGFDLENQDPNLGRPVSEDRLLQRVIESGRPVIIPDTWEEPDWDKQYSTRVVRSWIGLPIVNTGTTIAILTIDHSEPNNYTHELDEPLLQYSSQVAVAISNAKAYQQERTSRALQAAATAINSKLDREAVLIEILKSLQTVLNHDSANVMLIEGDYAHIKAEWGYPPDKIAALRETPLRIPDIPALRNMLQKNKSIVYADTDTEPDWIHIPISEGIHSYVGVPISSEGEFVGFLQLNSNTRGFFEILNSPSLAMDYFEMLRVFADHAGVAIGNANSYEAERQAHRHFEALSQATARLTTTLRPKDVLDSIVRNVTEIVAGGDSANIMLLHGQHLVVETLHGYDHRDPEKVSLLDLMKSDWRTFQKMMDTRQPIVIPDTDNDDLWVPIPSTDWIHSYLGAPIIVDDIIIGFLNVDSAMPDTFTQDHLQYLKAYAEQAALAIKNARLLTKEEALRKIATALSSPYNAHEMLQTVLDELHAYVEYSSASIQIKRGEVLQIVRCEGFAEQDKVLQLRFPINDSKFPNGVVIKSKEPLSIDDVHESYPHFNDETATYYSEQIRSWLGVPMVSRSEIVGMITVDRNKVYPFTLDEIEFTYALAAQTASALENQDLINRITVVSEVVEQLSKTADRDQILNGIATQIVKQTKCTHCAIFLPKKTTHDIEAAGQNNTQILLEPIAVAGEDSERIGSRTFKVLVDQDTQQSLAARAYVKQTSEIYADAQNEPEYAKTRQVISLKDRHSLLVVPISGQGKCLGVISADKLEYGWFGEGDLQLVEMLAHNAALAIERAESVEREILSQTWTNLGRLAATVAHRISNKGGIIRMSVFELNQKLMEIRRDQPEIRDSLDAIERNNRYLLNLSEALFQPGKALNAEMQSVDVTLYLQEALKYSEIPKNEVTVKTTFSRTLPKVKANDYLLEAFVELIDNGVSAMRNVNKKNLTIAAGRNRDDCVEIRITDTGVGMNQARQKEVFDLFSRAREGAFMAEKHWGFGLWWVKTYLTGIGGDIEVASTSPDAGTTFVVTLPITAETGD